MSTTIETSSSLRDVRYEIRGQLAQRAHEMERQGYEIISMNIGNPGLFGFRTPETMRMAMIENLPSSEAYCHQKGIFPAREAVVMQQQERGVMNVTVEHVFMGNGVSELIDLTLRALLNPGDEVLIPSPDYPLWTAAVTLNGGKAVHYTCPPETGFQPDLDALENLITARTRALVIINPNNPTGAVYPRAVLEEMLEIARENDLVVFADEIYDKILYENAEHLPLGSLADDLLILSLNGLSKTYRVAGFRTGWMVVSGAKHRAGDFIEGLDILASMRLCPNVPTQHAIQTALGGYQSIVEYLQPGGRLREQRDYAWQRLNAMEGVSCVKPDGALYLFPKLDVEHFNIRNDEQFALDLLRQEKVLVVQGTGFNWPEPDHFRVVFLPRIEDLEEALDRIEHFLGSYRQ